MWVNMRICYEQVAVERLPKVSRRALRPWISNTGLQLMSDRDVARAHGNHEVEKALTKSSKNAVNTDRTQWLNNILATGNWKEKKRTLKKMVETGMPGRWPRRCGKHLWADVLAQRFQTGQCCNRFTMGAIQW